jgi:hypothetical protein
MRENHGCFWKCIFFVNFWTRRTRNKIGLGPTRIKHKLPYIGRVIIFPWIAEMCTLQQSPWLSTSYHNNHHHRSIHLHIHQPRSFIGGGSATATITIVSLYRFLLLSSSSCSNHRLPLQQHHKTLSFYPIR